MINKSILARVLRSARRQVAIYKRGNGVYTQRDSSPDKPARNDKKGVIASEPKANVAISRV